MIWKITIIIRIFHSAITNMRRKREIVTKIVSATTPKFKQNVSVKNLKISSCAQTTVITSLVNAWLVC